MIRTVQLLAKLATLIQEESVLAAVQIIYLFNIYVH